jgi:hypothetical protein
VSYLHIDNLYKDQAILHYKECYAMEKIHGTSAHVTFKNGAVSLVDGHIEEPVVSYFAGGEKHQRFVALFSDMIELAKVIFRDMGYDELTVFGEAYGGKCQGMKETYGVDLRFVAYEVKIGTSWLNVDDAEMVAKKLGFEFVHYVRIPATLEAIEEQIYLPSVQAMRNGCGDDKMREGVVLRPLIEVRRNNGSRIIAKHKRPEFAETRTVREVKPETAQLIEESDKVALEFVTEERMRHVLDALIATGKMCEEYKWDICETKWVIGGMLEDILREGAGELRDTREVRKAIGTASAKLYKQLIGRQFLKEVIAGAAFKGSSNED